MLLRFSWLLFTVAFVATAKADPDEKAGDEVKIETLTPPPADCERKTKRHDNVAMHYIGTLTETGVKFDSSHDRKQPFEFQLGTGQVITGWDEGLMDMCVGEKRKLVIPASKGYGEQGTGDIPPNAGLTFEVELLEIKDGSPPPNIFKQIDSDADNQLSQDEVSEYLKKQQKEYGQGEDGEQTTEEQHKELISQIFQHEDADKDGYISHEEFSGPKHDEL